MNIVGITKKERKKERGKQLIKYGAKERNKNRT
jgi:hypothetical protein